MRQQLCPIRLTVPLPPLRISPLCRHCSIMSATCHAKCPLICLWRSLRNLHFICTTCDPDELFPLAPLSLLAPLAALPPLPPCLPCPLLLCLPACSQLPLRIQFFIFMRRLECPPASGINAFPSITLPPSLPPSALFSCSSYPAGVYLLICVWLHCSLALTLLGFLLKCLQVICRVALCCEFSFCFFSFFGLS